MAFNNTHFSEGGVNLNFDSDWNINSDEFNTFDNNSGDDCGIGA